MTEQKFCKDCKWLVQTDFSNYSPSYDCQHPSFGKSVNVVTGLRTRNTHNAEFSRLHETLCGEMGDWWEPNPPTYWQKLKTYFQ